jgi:muconolactone delta-isomerase
MKEQIEKLVLPTFDHLAGLEKEGRIRGGVAAGARQIVFVVEAKTNEEVDDVIRGMPVWPMVTTEVTPLTAWHKRKSLDERLIAHMNA